MNYQDENNKKHRAVVMAVPSAFILMRIYELSFEYTQSIQDYIYYIQAEQVVRAPQKYLLLYHVLLLADYRPG